MVLQVIEWVKDVAKEFHLDWDTVKTLEMADVIFNIASISGVFIVFIGTNAPDERLRRPFAASGSIRWLG